jgi:Uma2 family endonuclease
MAVREATQTLPVAFSSLLRRYTLEEFWALPEPDGRAHYELIRGVLYKAPPPDPPHGSIDARLAHLLHRFLITHNIPGEIHHPREAIYVDETYSTYLEPDMMYVSPELQARMGTRRISADIVFEYLSKGTANYDRTTKADTYLALRVRELWLLDPDSVTIEVRSALQAGKSGALPSWERHVYTVGQWAESRALPGWQVSVDEVFAELG